MGSFKKKSFSCFCGKGIEFLSLLIILFSFSFSSAITISVVRNSGHYVKFKVSASWYTTYGRCFFKINFGDGTGWQNLGECLAVSPCNLYAEHIYRSSGDYTVWVKSLKCVPSPIPPDPAFIKIKVGLPEIKLSVIPNSLKIFSIYNVSRTVTYKFKSSIDFIKLTSYKGEFWSSSSFLGAVKSGLDVSILNGYGEVKEKIAVPFNIIKKAILKGIRTIRYKRVFFNKRISVEAVVNIHLPSPNLCIKHIRLYFNNNSSTTQVCEGSNGLKAYAKLDYKGSGLLEAYWKLDGKIIASIKRRLNGSNTLVLSVPENSSLPTCEAGVHILNFVVKRPLIKNNNYQLSYFVVPAKRFSISLVYPKRNSTLSVEDIKFVWKAPLKNLRYLIKFFNRNRHLIFSDYTREPFYVLNTSLFYKVFFPNNEYLWKVIGFDKKKCVVAESRVGEFKLAIPKNIVPGDILVVFSSKRFNKSKLKALSLKYNIKERFKFFLSSLNWNVVVFHTNRNIWEIIPLLKSEEDVILVQPHFIYSTFLDPLTSHQEIFSKIDLASIHKRYSGNGIRVAVVDTGIDIHHVELKGRIKKARNFIFGERYRPETHGTAVAGIIAASQNGKGITGIAPKADLLTFRACREIRKSSPGACFTYSLLLALDASFSSKAKIVNLSLGSTDYDPLLSYMISHLAKKGIFILAPLWRGNNFPAIHPSVIAVGGIDPYGNPYPTMQVAKNADVLAPAVRQLTTVPGNKYAFLSGTSLSTACVSGLLALVLEKNPSITLEKVKRIGKTLKMWENSIKK